jgi:hypothetical protein
LKPAHVVVTGACTCSLKRAQILPSLHTFTEACKNSLHLLLQSLALDIGRVTRRSCGADLCTGPLVPVSS